MCIKFPAPEKGVNSAFSEANTTFFGVCALKQMAVESSCGLHTVMCPGATDRSNPAMWYLSSSEVSVYPSSSGTLNKCALYSTTKYYLFQLCSGDKMCNNFCAKGIFLYFWKPKLSSDVQSSVKVQFYFH